MDTSYEYFTLQAKDKAGNMSEIYKVGNPYYENPDAVKENTEVSGTEQNAASLPADGTASKSTSSTATVTEHQTTNETATAPTELAALIKSCRNYCFSSQVLPLLPV